MSYNRLAHSYDKLMNHVPFENWVTFTTSILHNKNLNIHNIVDLGCGTGEITIKLAKQGFALTGVDISSDMLSIGSKKSIEQQVPITWIHQDIRQLSGFEQVDLFISFCDVINYITSKQDILSVFNSVYTSLKDDGYFIFDVHSIYYVTNQLINHTFADVNDDITYIWECVAGENFGEMYHYLTFFSKTNESLYERFTETHHQRTWEVEEYEQLLKKIGFSKVEFYGDFSLEKANLKNNYERIFIVAKK